MNELNELYTKLSKHFGDIIQLAKAIGLKHQTVYGWKYRKSIKFSQAMMIQDASKGKFKAHKIMEIFHKASIEP